jgi:hypothetical protein
MASDDDLRLEVENVSLRRLLAQAGIHAAEPKLAERMQRVLLKELQVLTSIPPSSGRAERLRIGAPTFMRLALTQPNERPRPRRARRR